MMDLSNSERAEVLVQALPNIQHYSGHTVVIKYGGNAMKSKQLEKQVTQDVVLLAAVGVHAVLVHGGGPAISQMMKLTGKASTFIDGLRVTDKETVDLVQMVLAGKINKSLVNLLQACGGRAIGLAGMDDGMIEAEIKDPKYGYVGKITAIHPAILNDLIGAGYIPVIATVGCDQQGNAYNINADTAAGEIASVLHAERLIMMSDISGIMRDIHDPSTLIPHLTINETRQLYEDGIVAGGMIPKVECCVNAVEKGVKASVILDGTRPHALLMELLTDEGAGTMIEKE